AEGLVGALVELRDHAGQHPRLELTRLGRRERAPGMLAREGDERDARAHRGRAPVRDQALLRIEHRPVVALRIRYLGGDLHRGRGERVHEVEDPGQGAEVPTERELAAETPSGTAEDGDVRATESVDRLLLVAHQEERNARAGELLDDLGL